MDLLLASRRGGAKTKWAKRQRLAAAKRRRIERAKVRRNKAVRLMSGSLQASLTFGALAVGISDAEWSRL